ncbi:MAG: hypothetical protein EZS28_054841 [Streblomastix strix]|uniref:Uncharacterized protein n=1 Tax=Streblomastix strix TaxID=222440 RepID=A0A5J4QCK6_9EUKA|nr:MAG: hypothetical protein EZS28_054841 [Streblomastix strix]
MHVIMLEFEEFLNDKQTKKYPFQTLQGTFSGEIEVEILYEAPTAPKKSESIQQQFASQVGYYSSPQY